MIRKIEAMFKGQERLLDSKKWKRQVIQIFFSVNRKWVFIKVDILLIFLSTSNALYDL